MSKGLMVLFLGISVGSIFPLIAAEPIKFDIEQDATGKVIVNCEYASKASSEYLQQIIGAPYTVANENGDECTPQLTITPKPIEPIIGAPGIPIPIGPRCKCPETYQAELQLRWLTMYQEKHERNKQDLLKQFENMEIILDKKNLKHLLDRPEFGTLNQLRQ